MYFLSKILGAALTPIRTLFYWIGRLIPGLKKLPKISLPMRCALLMVLFLIVLIITLWLKWRLDPFAADFWVRNWIWTIPALIAIPIITYFAVKLLLQGDVSQFPDIDFAWKQGLEALKQHAIPLEDTPLFLIVGNANHDVAARICRASQISMNVTQTPEGPAPLHWYANQDSIFLFLTDASCMSKLAEIWADPSNSQAAGPTPATGSPAKASPAMGTIVAGAPDNASSDIESPAHDPTAASAGAPAPSRPISPIVMQTMEVNPTKNVSAADMQQPVTSHQKVRPMLPALDVNDQEARLEYVCKRLRKTRYPVCPVNGILALIPFGLVEAGADQVQIAVQRDMNVFREKLKLRCPVTVLINGMEDETGFRELVRRVGVDRAQIQRFGKGNHIWNPPTMERLDALARHSCGAFEDWTYMLFREHDGLRKPGNTKLFSLLCKIRGGFSDALANILENGFGYDQQRDQELGEQQLMFSGCYFAASGETEDRQAFVQGVMRKMIEQEAELSWAPEAIHENEQFKLFANLLALLAVISLIILLGMIGNQQGWLDTWLRPGGRN